MKKLITTTLLLTLVATTQAQRCPAKSKDGKLTYNTNNCGNRAFTWTGKDSSGILNGTGVLTMYQADTLYYTYTGTILNGEFEGKATLAFKDGSGYAGDYQKGNYHGNGVYTYKDGTKYEGQFADDKRHGQGKLYYKNGKVAHSGSYKNDAMHGKGTTYLEDGQIRYDGEFENDKPHGKGTGYLDGNKVEGTFKDGIPYNGTVYNAAGKKIGKIKNGEFKD